MRIDAHTHIFPPEIVGDRDRFFSDEPAFRLLYDSPKAKLVTAESLLDAMDSDQVDRSVVFGFPWCDGNLSQRHNDYVLNAASKHPLRLIPMACMNPLDKRSPEEAERCLRSGARGLGELAIYGQCDPDDALKSFSELIDCCRSHGGVMLVHANEPVGHSYPGKAPLGLDFYYSLCRRASEIDMILAHWGGGLCFYELLKREVRDVLARVYYDTAASPYLYQPSIYTQLARMLDLKKILFGSDYPLLRAGRYFKEMASAGLSTEEIDAVCGENAAHLLLGQSSTPSLRAARFHRPFTPCCHAGRYRRSFAERKFQAHKLTA